MTKLALAALSGFLVMLAWLVFADVDNALAQIGFYGLTGLLFAAGVLLPYLRRQDLTGWRAVAVVALSGISFYCAVRSASDWYSGMWGPEFENYVVASFVGAAIVLIPAPFLLSLRYSLKYAVAGFVAALLGGLAFPLFDDLFYYSMFLCFGCWHMFMCLALHIANPEVANDRWLASGPRWRIAIVAGAFSLFIVVPLLDDGIGAIVQYRYSERDAGLTVHERVTARGFRDEREKPVFYDLGCGFGCADRITDGTYAYQEYAVDDPRGDYVVLFLAERPDPNCGGKGDKWDSPFHPIFRGSGGPGEGWCLSYRLLDDPVAEYAVRDRRLTVDAVLGLYPLRQTVRQVVRLSDGAVIAEAIYFQYDSRFFGDTAGTLEKWETFLREALPPATGSWQPPE